MRQDRLNKYAKPLDPSHLHGESCNEYIKVFSDRAHQLSDGHRHRAKSGAMELPTTGEMNLHPTAGRAGDQREIAKSDKNFVGTKDYMPGVRRNA